MERECNMKQKLSFYRGCGVDFMFIRSRIWIFKIWA